MNLHHSLELATQMSPEQTLQAIMHTAGQITHAFCFHLTAQNLAGGGLLAMIEYTGPDGNIRYVNQDRHDKLKREDDELKGEKDNKPVANNNESGDTPATEKERYEKGREKGREKEAKRIEDRTVARRVNAREELKRVNDRLGEGPRGREKRELENQKKFLEDQIDNPYLDTTIEFTDNSDQIRANRSKSIEEYRKILQNEGEGNWTNVSDAKIMKAVKARQNSDGGFSNL